MILLQHMRIGLVGPGEEVLLVREPQNRFDRYRDLFYYHTPILPKQSFRNAIQVKNIAHVQVGHLPRNVVAKLAPLLDRRAIAVEGVINDGNCNYIFIQFLFFVLTFTSSTVNSNGYNMSMYAVFLLCFLNKCLLLVQSVL